MIIATNKSELWRAGTIQTFSPVFDKWCERNINVTIKPNIHPREVCAEYAKQSGDKPENVRIALLVD